MGPGIPSIDSSLAFIFAYGPFNAADDVVVNTMNAIAKQLWVSTDLGGLARYENDEYRRTSKDIPGNPWFISTLWLARWYFAKANSFEELKRWPGLTFLGSKALNSIRHFRRAIQSANRHVRICTAINLESCRIRECGL